MNTNIFKEVTKGSLQLKNRIAMAPMTRARNEDGIPKDFNAILCTENRCRPYYY